MSYTSRYAGEIINSLTKVTLWIPASIYLIKRYESTLKYSLKDLFYIKRPIITSPIGIWLTLISICICLIRRFMLKGYLLNKNFQPSDLIWIAIVGFTEEILFRGWIQNALTSKMKASYAMIGTNILFIIIHFPIQVHNGVFPNFSHFLNIFVLGIFFSYSLDKTKNLWVPIFLHTLWDLLIIIF
jgi:membrane protease YdiL (CAAX protease family)